MITDYLKQALNTQLFGAGTAFTKPSTYYLGLWTADPTGVVSPFPAGEASGGSYARKACAWTLIGNDYVNTSDITFNLPIGTFTHGMLLDSATLGAGNPLFYGAFSVPISMTSAGTTIVPAQSIRALFT